jgi:hypothetical protein
MKLCSLVPRLFLLLALAISGVSGQVCVGFMLGTTCNVDWPGLLSRVSSLTQNAIFRL